MQDLVVLEHLIAHELAKLPDNAGMDVVVRAFGNASAKSFQHCTRFGDDLAPAALLLANDAVALQDLSLTDPRQNNLTGLSGLPLYFAKSGQNIVATIKAFPCKSPQFAQTLWATRHLERLTGNCPRALAVGRATKRGEDFLLVALEFVPGEIINDRLIAIATMPSGFERMKKLDKLCPIIHKLGAFLGKLHTSGPSFHDVASSRVKDAHAHAIACTLRGLATSDFGVDVYRLERDTADLVNTMIDHEYRHAFCHGDAHPGNYLYDSVGDRIVALDLDAGAVSIGSAEKPLGSPWTDYIRITASMKIRELIGITSDETSTMRYAFDSGYTEHGGKLPPHKIITYYTVMEVFDYAAWYFEHENQLKPDVKAFMTQILLTGLGWLRELSKK